VAIELTITWCSSPSPTLVVATTTTARHHSSTILSHSLIYSSTPQQFQPTLATASSPLTPLSSPSSPTQPHALERSWMMDDGGNVVGYLACLQNNIVAEREEVSEVFVM